MKTSKTLVFDIQRFSIHDGDGLRTTVFFKGCPLRCQWCQNPEGLSSQRRPLYFEKRCIHCRLCEKAAKPGQMVYENDRPYFQLDYQGDFENLVDACPTAAICYDSHEYDVESLLQKIKEDQVFFRDKGGVTFSGGEPFMQGTFLVDILKRCQEEGIHTAIESSLHAPFETIQAALPYLDQIYADFKIFDECHHQKYIGASAQMIKAHMKYLLSSPYRDKVIVRTPLIPTMTATDENIASIAQFLVEIYPDVRYELLNYNPLASSKYDLVDLEYGVDQRCQKLTKAQLQHIYDIVQKSGLKNLINKEE